MVEKRLFLFVVLSIAIWGGYLALQFALAPPPKPQDVAGKQDVQQAKVDNKQADDKAAQEQKAEDEQPAEKPPEKRADEPAPPPAQPPRQRVTLGSLDPSTGYTMLVTFDNRGAGIERIEFGERFHDLDDRSGYLGHLALTEVKGGLLINVVGPGTPAARAQGDDGSFGLKVGDVITAVNGDAVSKAADFEEFRFRKTRPRDELQLTVQRGSGSDAVELQFTIRLIRRPLELIRPEDNNDATAVDLEYGKLGPFGPPSYRLTLRQVGDTTTRPREAEFANLPSLYDANWELALDEKTDTVTFTTRLSAEQLAAVGGGTSLKFTKTYRLAKASNPEKRPHEYHVGAYHLDFGIKIENTGNKPEKIAYRLEGPNGLPIEGWWYSNKVHPGWAGAGARDVAYKVKARRYQDLLGLPALVANATKQVKEGNPPTTDLFLGVKDNRDLQYLAVDTQYFASALLPAEALDRSQPGEKTFAVDAAYGQPINLVPDKKWLKTTNISFYIDSTAEELSPGDSLTSDLVIFAGPKEPQVLNHYGMPLLIEYGWFGWVSDPLRRILWGFWYFLNNYGLSIILLTVMVRLCLLPFSIRQAKSAAVMQELAPEMAKIKEKYAGDMEKQATAQRELWAKHGFNPMGGCLLMLAQLPIFIGLYRCLATDIDLREASLIPGIHWAANLAGPDEVFRWKEYVWRDIGDEGHGWLGPYFNILPLVTVALFLVQQKLFSPPAVDDEQKMQQKIMNFMMIFMGVMFYKVPAGLCIYFITSSLWGIAERKLLPKPKPKSSTAAASVGEGEGGGDGRGDGRGGGGKKPPSGPSKPNGGSSGGPSMLERLFGMADAQLKQSKSQPAPTRKKAKK